MTGSKIKAKISALLAKARGTDNDHEASIFLAKAQEMLDAHQLSEFELGDASDPVGHTVSMSGNPSTPTWKVHLLRGLATYYGCKTIRNWKFVDGKECWDIVITGRESARVTLDLMYPFVIKQCASAGRSLASQGHGKADAMTRRVGNALVSRVTAMIYEAQKLAAANREKPATALSASESLALVIIDEVAAAYAAANPNVKQQKTKSRSTTGAARELAGKISIARQVGGAGMLRIGR